MHAEPADDEPGGSTVCQVVDDEIGGPGGIWLERKDTEAPAAPQLTGTDPASPGLSGTPRIKGIAEAGSTVAIFESSTCMGTPVATGSAAELSSPGLTVNVPEEVTAKFSALATDAAGNESDCSAPISYTHQKAKVDPKPDVKPTPGKAVCKKAKAQRNKANRKVKQARKKTVQLRNRARVAKSKKRAANLRRAGKRWQNQVKRRQATQRKLNNRVKRVCR